MLTHDRDDHVVLIDDARLFGTGDYPTIDDVRAQVARHRPNWLVDVHTDIIRAHRPDVRPRGPVTDPAGSGPGAPRR